MSWKLSFDPMEYGPLNEYGKGVMQVLVRTWVTKETENMEIVKKQLSFDQEYIREHSSLQSKKNTIFGSTRVKKIEVQDYNNFNFENEENFDSQIIPRISLSPINTSPSRFVKPLPKIKQMIQMSYENDSTSKDIPLQIDDDTDEIIPATILPNKYHNRHCKLLKFQSRYKTPQAINSHTIQSESENITKPERDNSKKNMPIDDIISKETIPKNLTNGNRNKDNDNIIELATSIQNDEISWADMTDEELFGLSHLENPRMNEKKTVENKEANNDFFSENNKPWSIIDTYSKLITNQLVEENAKQGLCAVEAIPNTTDKGTKRKYKQKEKSDELTKKVKNTTVNIEKVGATRKKKSSAIVNDWLKNNTAEFDTETIETEKSNGKCNTDKNTTDLLPDPTADTVIKKNNKPNFISRNIMKQTRLVNKGGIMKFTEKDKSQNAIPPTLIPKKCDEAKIVEKIKKKPKFTVPFKSQIPVSDITYEVDELIHSEAISTFESVILSHDTTVIAMTIIYREGFCQLNKKYDGHSCLPEGLMICRNKSSFYYIPLLNKKNNGDNEFRQFFRNLMLSPIRKICFEAQDLMTLFMDLFKLEDREISLKWILEDPKIGCFLLDPDKPPECFFDLQSKINLTCDFTISSSCVKQKTAWCLTLLVECADKIHAELKDNSLMKIFQMETKLIAIISVMELRGLSVNEDKLKQIGRTIEDKMKSVEMQAYQCTDKVFQINSPVQLRTILYEELKLDQKCNIKVRETICLGAKSTSEPILKLLAASHPLPRLVLEYRHLHKALATFVNGTLQHVKNGVIKATWEQTAAATGRISSSNPNLQTIPKNPFVLTLFPTSGQEIEAPVHLRSAYTAREGYILLAADFQHIESRIFAHLSGDEGLMEVFRQNEDFFRTLAGKWMNKVEEDVTRAERDRTKRMVYASMYGAGTKKLMEILEIDYEQTSATMASFTRVFPSLKAFSHKIVEKCLRQGGVLESICGRRRRFPNIYTQNLALKAQAERQAVNFVIQGSAADLCKIAMIVTEEHLMKQTVAMKCGLVLQIHDELVWEVDEEYVSLAKDVIKLSMESCGEVCGLSIPLPVSVTSGRNWADMK